MKIVSSRALESKQRRGGGRVGAGEEADFGEIQTMPAPFSGHDQYVLQSAF